MTQGPRRTAHAASHERGGEVVLPSQVAPYSPHDPSTRSHGCAWVHHHSTPPKARTRRGTCRSTLNPRNASAREWATMLQFSVSPVPKTRSEVGAIAPSQLAPYNGSWPFDSCFWPRGTGEADRHETDAPEASADGGKPNGDR